MSETATQAQIRDSRDPIINSLVPMFLGYAGDDVALARRTAVNTINCYRFQGHAELIAVVQVITFAMSAIRALGLTMTDEIPLELIARFQSNGVALGKSEQVLRKILRNPPAEQRYMAPLKPEPAPAAAAPLEPEPTPAEAAPPEPATQSGPPLPSEPAPPAEDQPRAEQPTTAPRPTCPAPSQAGPTAVPDPEAAETFAQFEAFITGKTQQMPPLPFGSRRPMGLPAAALGSAGTDLPRSTALDEQDDAASMPPEHAFLAHQATSDLAVAPPQGGG